MTKRKQSRKTSSDETRETLDKAMKIAMSNTPAGQKLRMGIHQQIGGGDVYLRQIDAGMTKIPGGVGEVMKSTATAYVKDVIDQMKPRDPLEEMLVLQSLWAHGRAAHLAKLANQQNHMESLRRINDSADKASNTFRRLMLALVEYRRPPRAGDSFTAIKQANIANQQVIQNAQPTQMYNTNTTNEQGCSESDADQTSKQKTLPADGSGVAVATTFGSKNEGLAVEHRAENPCGQGAIKNECLETR